MKLPYRGLSRATGILLGVYALEQFTYNLILIIIRDYSYNFPIWGVVLNLFSLLFEGLLFVGMVVLAFFVPRNKILSVPVWIFSISTCGYAVVYLIVLMSEASNSGMEAWYWAIYVLTTLLDIAIVVLSSVLLGKTKPFRKEKNKGTETKGNSPEITYQAKPKEPMKSISLDDLIRAKELLDAGIINQEEFGEIKKRALQ